MGAALQPLLVNPPKPVFILRWDEEARNWRSEFAAVAELPGEIHRVLEGFGYGCLREEDWLSSYALKNLSTLSWLTD
jgi:hypothetical protein